MAIILPDEEGLLPDQEVVLTQDGRRIHIIGAPEIRAVGDDWVDVPRVEGMPLDDFGEASEQFRAVPWRAEVPLWTVELEPTDDSAVPGSSAQPRAAQASTSSTVDEGAVAGPRVVRRRARYADALRRTETEERSERPRAEAPAAAAPAVSAVASTSTVVSAARPTAAVSSSSAVVGAAAGAAAAATTRPRTVQRAAIAAPPKKCFNCGSPEHLRANCNCRDNRLCGLILLATLNRLCPVALCHEPRPVGAERRMWQEAAERELRRRISWGLATPEDLKQLKDPERVLPSK